MNEMSLLVVLTIRNANDAQLGLGILRGILLQLIHCQRDAVPDCRVAIRYHIVELMAKILDGVCNVLRGSCSRTEHDEANAGLEVISQEPVHETFKRLF